ARASAAAVVNVAPSKIAKGHKLLETGVPGLVEAVERGAVTMSVASRVAELGVDAQQAVVARGRDAIAEEAKRLASEQKRGKPSFARAMLELDELNEAWTLQRHDDGHYTLEIA